MFLLQSEVGYPDLHRSLYITQTPRLSNWLATYRCEHGGSMIIRKLMEQRAEARAAQFFPDLFHWIHFRRVWEIKNRRMFPGTQSDLALWQAAPCR